MLNKGLGPNLELTGSEVGTFERWDLAKVFRSLGTRTLQGIMGVQAFSLPFCSFLTPFQTGSEWLCSATCSFHAELPALTTGQKKRASRLHSKTLSKNRRANKWSRVKIFATVGQETFLHKLIYLRYLLMQRKLINTLF